MDRGCFRRTLSKESILCLRKLDLCYLFSDLPSNSFKMSDSIRKSFSRMHAMPGYLPWIFLGHKSIPGSQRTLVRVAPQGQNSNPNEFPDRDRFCGECGFALGFTARASFSYRYDLGSHPPLLLHTRNYRYF